MRSEQEKDMTTKDHLADVIFDVLRSPNEADSNFEPANVVDGLYFIGRAIHRLADAVNRANGVEPE
jgi:hypothetical protein